MPVTSARSSAIPPRLARGGGAGNFGIGRPAGSPCLARPGSGTMPRMPRSSAPNPRRRIPPVARLLAAPEGLALTARYRRERVVDTLRLVLGELRRQVSDGASLPTDEELIAAAAPR